MKESKSKCCNADIITYTDVEDGTGFYLCAKCNKETKFSFPKITHEEFKKKALEKPGVREAYIELLEKEIIKLRKELQKHRRTKNVRRKNIKKPKRRK